MLNLQPPQYRFNPTNPSTPSLLSGAAYFPGTPYSDLQGPIGEVRNVFGKKNAKEECARGVWDVLVRVAKKRGVDVEMVGE